MKKNTKTLKCAGSSNEVVVVVAVGLVSAPHTPYTIHNPQCRWLFAANSRANSLAKLSSSNKAKTASHAQLRMEMLVKRAKTDRQTERGRETKKWGKKKEDSGKNNNNIAHFKMSVECDN